LKVVGSARCSEQIPEAAEKVKSVLGKGWVKNVLTQESQIETVDVPGVDEPCFRICGVEIKPPPAKESKPKQPQGGGRNGKGSGKRAGSKGKPGSGKSLADQQYMEQMMMAMYMKGQAKGKNLAGKGGHGGAYGGACGGGYGGAHGGGCGGGQFW